MIGNYGQKIRALRNRRNMTLAELGEAAGVSVSYVSQIERGLCSVSLSSLAQIAKSLGVSVEYLFYDGGDYIDIQSQLTSHYTCPPDKPYYYKVLSNTLGNKNLRVYDVTFLPRDNEYSLPIGDKAGYIYMLKGLLTITWNGEEEIMYHGDSLYFDGSVEYKFFNRNGGLINFIYATFDQEMPER